MDIIHKSSVTSKGQFTVSRKQIKYLGIVDKASIICSTRVIDGRKSLVIQVLDKICPICNGNKTIIDMECIVCRGTGEERYFSDTTLELYDTMKLYEKYNVTVNIINHFFDGKEYQYYAFPHVELHCDLIPNLTLKKICDYYQFYIIKDYSKKISKSRRAMHEALRLMEDTIYNEKVIRIFNL